MFGVSLPLSSRTRVRDGDRPDVVDVRQDVGPVEDRRDRLPPARLADHREVRDRDGPALLERRHPPHLGEAAAVPARAVDHEPVADLEDVRAHVRRQRRLVGPPQRDRQVVDEQRRDDRLEVPAGLAAARQVDRLGARRRRALARDHAMGLDVRVEPGRAVGVGRRDDQRPRRVASREVVDDRRAAFAGLGPAGDDDEVHDARPRADLAIDDAVVIEVDVALHRRVAPDPGELLLDALDRRRPRSPGEDRPARLAGREHDGLGGVDGDGHQIRLQRRPSRANS